MVFLSRVEGLIPILVVVVLKIQVAMKKESHRLKSWLSWSILQIGNSTVNPHNTVFMFKLPWSLKMKRFKAIRLYKLQNISIYMTNTP